ncbi:MAG: hypothetical protein A2Z88_00320 [Omnitrophica WOR_2 bacterium GWA2_47_8]|nr:MAG: hypothetical protein A2Z88_00320 [Omnitrophica WOR_2 bacterium GWA2_47_8]
MQLGKRKGLKSKNVLEAVVVITVALISSYAFAQVALIRVWQSNPISHNSPPIHTLAFFQQLLGNTTYPFIVSGSDQGILNMTNATYVDIDVLDGYTGRPVWKSRQYGMDTVDTISVSDDNNHDGIKDPHVYMRTTPTAATTFTMSKIAILSGVNGQELGQTYTYSNSFSTIRLGRESDPVRYLEQDVTSDGKKEIFAIEEDGSVSGYYLQ